MSRNGAISTRLDRDWPVIGTGFHDRTRNTVIGDYRTRAQELYDTNAIATGIVRRSIDNIIGTGMTPQAKTADSGWNAAAEELLDEWSADGADVRRMNDLFTGLQPLWMQEAMVGGDTAIVLLRDGSLQTIDGGDIETPPGKASDDSIVDGVKVDRLGRPVGYYVLTDDEKQNYTWVPARDMIYFPQPYDPLRPKQVRGVTAFRPAIDSNLLDMIDGSLEAVVAAAQMAAMFGLILEEEAGPGTLDGLPATTDTAGNAAKEFTMEPGMVKFVRPGTDIKQVTPQQPGENYGELVILISRYLGVPFGLPLELVLMDFSRTNYSSARASLLQAYRAFRKIQKRFANRVLRRIYNWRISKWIKSGELTDRPDAWRHNWNAPGWAWVDPEKEGKANLIALDAGTTSLARIAQDLGQDWEEIIAERAAELKAQEAAGITPARSTATREEGTEGEEPPPDDDSED
jgi:lambda family phage portal protein